VIHTTNIVDIQDIQTRLVRYTIAQMTMAKSHYATPDVLQTKKIYPIFYSRSESPGDGAVYLGGPVHKIVYHKYIIDYESMSWLVQNAVQTLGGWSKSNSTETELIDRIHKDWTYIGAFQLQRLKHHCKNFFYIYTSLHHKERKDFMQAFLSGVPVQRTLGSYGEGYVRHVAYYIPITHLNPTWSDQFLTSSVAFVINRYSILRGKSANYFKPESLGTTDRQLLMCLMVGCSMAQMNVMFFPNSRSNLAYIRKYLEFLASDSVRCCAILNELDKIPTTELYTELIRDCAPVAQYARLYGETALFQRRLTAEAVFSKIDTGGRMNWHMATVAANAALADGGSVELPGLVMDGGVADTINAIVYDKILKELKTHA
jgi:hypothetical protein